MILIVIVIKRIIILIRNIEDSSFNNKVVERDIKVTGCNVIISSFRLFKLEQDESRTPKVNLRPDLILVGQLRAKFYTKFPQDLAL